MSNALSFDELYKMKYDKEGDVLYITVVPNEIAVSSKEAKDGLVWRYNADQKVIGVTVQWFKGYWTDTIRILALRIVIRVGIFNTETDHIARDILSKFETKLQNILMDAV